MSWIIDPKEEHPLWRNYIDKLDLLSPKEQLKWMKEVKLPTSINFPIGKSHATLSQKEFLDRLQSDPIFNDMWGQKLSPYGEI